MLFVTNMIASKYLSLASCTISSFSKQLSTIILLSRTNFFYSYDHYFYATFNPSCSPGRIPKYQENLEKTHSASDYLCSPPLERAILLQIYYPSISGFLVNMDTFWDYYSLDCDFHSNNRNSLFIWHYSARCGKL